MPCADVQKGTSFRVLSAHDGFEGSSIRPMRRTMQNGQQGGLPRLLIVDDDPSIRFSMVAVLDEIGFSVRSADNGFAALAEIGREAPDIVLSDLNMPGMSGFEFLGVVRKHFPSIHLIAMSGSFSGDEVPSGVTADAFYPKVAACAVCSSSSHASTSRDRWPGTAKLPRRYYGSFETVRRTS